MEQDLLLPTVWGTSAAQKHCVVNKNVIMRHASANRRPGKDGGKKLPMILALHRKWFKYIEQLHRHTKPSYWAIFPLDFQLVTPPVIPWAWTDVWPDPCVLSLCHGHNCGHYITVVRSHAFWLLFDDDCRKHRCLRSGSLMSDIAKKIRIWLYFILSVERVT